MASTGQALDPISLLAERFTGAIRAAVADLGKAADTVDPMITPSKRPDLADFQCNAAMPLAKSLGLNPRELASAIIQRLDLADIAEPVTEANIAGPGFINIRLKTNALAGMLDAMDRDDLGIPPAAHPQTIVVDLFGVNLAKQMHVGHLRSTIIGDALVRVFQRLGHHVIRQSHVGDWGLPIAMVTHRLMRESAAGRINPDLITLDDLDRLYREAQAEANADRAGLAAVQRFGLGPKAKAELEEQVAGAEEAAAAGRRTLLRLQSRDPEVVAVWKRIYDITMDEGLRICRRLRTTITREDTAGESTYADELAEVVEDLVRRGIAVESERALVVRVEGVQEPCLIRKSDGGFLYATTDIAAIRRRVHKLGADRIIYCIDARQSLHLRQVFGTAIMAGYATRPGADRPSRLEHAAFGTVLGEDRRPFKTRTGENVRLATLLDEAVERAERVVMEKNPSLDARERREIAEAVGIASIKYADLSTDRVRDYVFSIDRMVTFEGNTGPYLQNAVVRIRSIFRKGAERGQIPADLHRRPLRIEQEAEKQLALALLQYPSTMAAVAETLEPHRLCTYLYDLAGAFTRFYETCPVLNADSEPTRYSRLRLADLTARVLTDGLESLGIPVLDRM